MKSKIKELIDKSNSIVLLAHEDPDGDAIGSLIAFYRILKNMNKDVMVIADKIPDRFNCLDDIRVITRDTDRSFDLGIILDCASLERIGEVSNITDRAKHLVVIDHHISNTLYGSVNYIDDKATSCTQILYYLFKDWNVEIDKECAKALMTGVITDSGGFKNNNVNKFTYLMAADMADIGVDIYNLQRKVLTMTTLPQMILKKIALERLELLRDGKIAFTYITKEDMTNAKALLGDHEGLVDLGRDIVGVEVSVFMREDDEYKISLRSNGKIDVREIAYVFGGGGHMMAAGLKINKSFEEVKHDIINETIKVVDKYEWNTDN